MARILLRQLMKIAIFKDTINITIITFATDATDYNIRNQYHAILMLPMLQIVCICFYLEIFILCKYYTIQLEYLHKNLRLDSCKHSKTNAYFLHKIGSKSVAGRFVFGGIDEDGD
jgi:hypothetical protein